MKKKEKTEELKYKSSNHQVMAESSNMGLSEIALVNEANYKTCYTTYSVLQVRENCIVKYNTSINNTAAHLDVLRENLKKAKNTYQGEISPAGQKKINKIIHLWNEAVKHHNLEESIAVGSDYRKLNMITVTLSDTQIHSDQEIKRKLLKPFLRILRERFGFENYLWKAESQDNGNIHFHVIVDKYIDKLVLNQIWNNVQSSIGYLDRYYNFHGHYDAPSTRVESLRDIENSSRYICKYITKNEQNRKINGALWKASEKLNTLCYYTVDESIYERQRLDAAVEKNECRLFCSDNFNVFSFEKLNLNKILSYQAMEGYRFFLNLLSEFLFSNTDYSSFKVEYLRLLQVSNLALARSELIDNYTVNRNIQKALYSDQLTFEF